MDIFVRGLPPQTTESALTTFFKPIMDRFSILKFHCKKFRSKPFALLTVTDIAKARRFLRTYSRGCESLYFFNALLQFTESRNKPDEFSLRALRREEEDLLRSKKKAAAESDAASRKLIPHEAQKEFEFLHLWCGTWDCSGPTMCFEAQSKDPRPGRVFFGKKALAMILSDENDPYTARIDIPYWSVESILTCPATHSVTFTLTFAPRFYRSEENTAEKMMAKLGLSDLASNQLNKRARVNYLSVAHRCVVGSCFVYRIQPQDPGAVATIYHFIQTARGLPPCFSYPTRSLEKYDFIPDRERLTDLLYPGGDYGDLEFSIKFQIERLARNGYLTPSKIIALLPTVMRLSHKMGHIATTMAIRTLSKQIPMPGPDVDFSSFDPQSMANALAQYARQSKIEDSIYDMKSWTSNQCALIHRAIITPTGVYLEGPEPEVGNRVLREYRDHGDHFLRVEFTDEDGDYVRYEARTDMSGIYSQRFGLVINAPISIGGRLFEFLGFSHSSLRQRTCWFMAPILKNGIRLTGKDVVEGLGDFSNIRCPAKCAARIGQAFSETRATETISEEMLSPAPDVVRNGRTFSDGVGTISQGLLDRVLKHFGQNQAQKPTCLQIRFAGAKGMVSLDTRVKGEVLTLRKSMMKFDGSKSWNIEVCGANFRPLPMYLNRQLVKILEDLGVPAQSFLSLEEQTIGHIRRIMETPLNAAIFLETSRSGLSLSTRMPFLFRTIDDLGLSFGGDTFLSHVVEVSVLSQLREVKYRSRILVEKGVTLYGIMDETGFLKEGEIYCTFNRTEARKPKQERCILEGDNVVITRSPAMHPGDVQLVRAVSDLPADSALRALSNVVVFSQKGSRDLPSQLSGGDLDGDLYNVIFDERLIPPKTHPAADYNPVPPMDIGRPVTQHDITKFFVNFMETDQLGRISTIHMQLADRAETGTLDAKCTKLAAMASTAVDFSKTGVPVDMRQCPPHDMIRPDFMAISPDVVVKKDGFDFSEEHDGDDDDEDAIQALDPDLRSFRYYESQHVLGLMYRAIDERTIFRDIHRHMQNDPRSLGNKDLMNRVWAYVLRETALLQWEGYKPFAREIREIYETNLLDVMSDYSMHSRHPLSEIEVFGGNIIGKSIGGGSTNRRIRERTVEMNQRFERDTAFVVQRILQGDDGDRDEALARSVACMAVGMTEKSSIRGAFGGEPRSWRYMAAAVCLQQIELFQAKYDPFW